MKNNPSPTLKSPLTTAQRASITFSAEQFQLLEKISTKKRVSIAWLVREAVHIYLENESKNHI